MNSKALIGNLKSWSMASSLVLGRSYLWSYKDYNAEVKGEGDVSFMPYNSDTSRRPNSAAPVEGRAEMTSAQSHLKPAWSQTQNISSAGLQPDWAQTHSHIVLH